MDEFLRRSPLLGKWRIDRAVDAEKVTGDAITGLQVIVPADDRVSLETNAHDRAFLQVCKYFQDGTYARPSTIVCEVPQAYCHVGSGLVCTRDFEALNDSQMTYRMGMGQATLGRRIYQPFQWFKPRHPHRLSGLYTTIGNVFITYWWHWIFDCLPRLHLLERASAGRPVVVLMPDDLAPSWYESLECVLPPHFKIRRLPGKTWVQVDTMLLASYTSSRANSHMAWEYYDFVRRACFARLQLPPENRPTERIYVSRADAHYRRILNEPALVELLGRYGFKSFRMDRLNFRQQVELFHRAEIVVAADGSNWSNMIFAGRIKIFILYSDATPNMHAFTAAKGLGQEHYFLAGPHDSPHEDFTVDLTAVEGVLRDQMGLSESAK